jgi:regulator of protease activity HflC (stomatin/prohibitin superfamily)
VAVITRFGKFLRVAEPGLNWKWPFIDRVAVSLRVNQITLTMETKTKDNVFVTIPICAIRSGSDQECALGCSECSFPCY